MKTHTVAEVKVFNALYILKEKGRRVKISAFTNTRRMILKKLLKKVFLRFFAPSGLRLA